MGDVITAWTRSVSGSAGLRFGLAVALALLTPFAAAGDRVTVKGTALEGTVTSIGAKKLVMKTAYGKGELVIALKNVEAIQTDRPFHVFHGPDVRTQGRVVGISPTAVVVADSDGTSTEIPFSSIHAIRRDPGPEADWFERRASSLAYWRGSLDLAFSAALATDDTLALATGFGLVRERGPSRLRLAASYRLATQDLKDASRETTQNEVLGQIRQEIDLTPRWFVFGSADAEYDQVERLSIRTTPKLGMGYVVHRSQASRLSVDLGGAYVYQRFFGGDVEDFPTAAFGLEHAWRLPLNGIRWRTRLDYTPSLTRWTEDWLLRGEGSLLVPLSRSLSFKASLLELYNSSPTIDTDENSFGTLLGLSLAF